MKAKIWEMSYFQSNEWARVNGGSLYYANISVDFHRLYFNFLKRDSPHNSLQESIFYSTNSFSCIFGRQHNRTITSSTTFKIFVVLKFFRYSILILKSLVLLLWHVLTHCVKMPFYRELCGESFFKKLKSKQWKLAEISA